MVEKSKSKNRTTSTIHKLDEEERVQEVARLLSGEEITESSLNGARELTRYGAEHRCAIKFKGQVIEAWIAYEFHGVTKTKIVHRSPAPSKRDLQEPSTPFIVFGFNANEKDRIKRNGTYDSPLRTGVYPLLDSLVCVCVDGLMDVCVILDDVSWMDGLGWILCYGRLD